MLAALPAVASTPTPQPANAAIRLSTPVETGFVGRVVDVATLQVVAGALVRTWPGSSDVTTDSSGSYVLPVSPGTYTVAVSSPGYIGTSQRNQVVSTTLQELDLTLIPESPSPDQQSLLYERLVKQSVSPLVRSDVLQRATLAGVATGLPPTITVYYDTANPPYSIAVPLEDYVKGVVPNEMPASWPASTLQAQAVAARCYGVASQLANGFVYPDTRSQVYNPNYRTNTTDAAVDATAGQVMTVNGSVIFAFFYAECNGVTTLDSEKANAYTTDSSGNIIYDSQGKAICVTSGWSYVSYCRARACTGHTPSSFSECGYYGHGVGLCQWGAYYRGSLSFTAILGTYYTGVTIGAIQSGPTPIPSPTLHGPFIIAAGQPTTLSWTGVGSGATYTGSILGSQTITMPTTSQTSWYVGPLTLGTYTWTIAASNGTSASATLQVVSKVFPLDFPVLNP